MKPPHTPIESLTFRQRCAAALKESRQALGMSQEVLAERAGFHRSYVSQIERAVQNMSLDNLERLQAILQNTDGLKDKPALRLLFAANMRAERISQGISQEKLAEIAGLHRTYVSQVERGVVAVSLDNVEKLARALARSAESLLI